MLAVTFDRPLADAANRLERGNELRPAALVMVAR